MKQKIFTLIMMLALVIVAGSAFGQTKFSPYAGGTYTYSIPIDLANDGTGTLTPSDAVNMGVTVNAPVLWPAVAQTVTQIDFTVIYTDAASGLQTITFVLTDGTSGCSNTIIAEIDIQPLPAINLTIAASIANTCQGRNATPADNVAETVGGTNSFTFTVTPDITNPPTAYGYTYDIVLNDLTGTLTAYDVAYTGAGAYVGTEAGGTVTCDEGDAETTGVFTVTWTTTTGIATQNVEATISGGVLTATSGGGTYDATYVGGDTDDVDINAVPGISPIN